MYGRMNNKMGSVKYAQDKLNRINKDKDGLQDAINKDILDIIKIFSEQGHSGTTASYTISMLERLLRFKPITPLTGEDDEWNQISDNQWQNKRCSSVFKYADGSVEDIDGIVYSDDGGITFWGSNRF